MGTPVFPGSVKTFTTKQDGVDTVVASHVNTLQDEVVGLQTHVGISSELPSLNLPSTSGTGAAVANRISPQINGLKQWADHLDTYKAPLQSPTFTGTVTLPSTTIIGGVSNTELGYLDGVTSSIQTQLNGKVSTSGGTISGTLTVTGVVKCAQGVASDDAVNRSQYDFATAYNINTYAKRPRANWPGHVYGGDDVAIVNGLASQSMAFSHFSSGTLVAYSCDGGAATGWVSVTPVSSRTIKKEIRDLTEEEIDTFDAITPQAFVMKDSEEFHFGFIAEDVSAAGVPVPMFPAATPDLTDLEANDTPVPGIYDRDMIAILWAQVKKQQEQIADLAQQVYDLTNA